MLFPLSIVIPSCIWLLTDHPGITLHSFLAFRFISHVGGGLSRYLIAFSITYSISYFLSFTGYIPCLRHRLLERDWCGCVCLFRFSVIAFFSAHANISISTYWYMHQAINSILFSQNPIHFYSLPLPCNANALPKHSPLQWYWSFNPPPFSITTPTPHHSHSLLLSPPSRFPLLSNESPKYPR